LNLAPKEFVARQFVGGAIVSHRGGEDAMFGIGTEQG
jgi:hypothetical protein